MMRFCLFGYGIFVGEMSTRRTIVFPCGQTPYICVGTFSEAATATQHLVLSLRMVWPPRPHTN